MRNYFFSLLGVASLFLVLSCNSSNSEKSDMQEEIQKEEKIADEVIKTSEEAKTEAEETEKEVDELLEGI